MCKLLNETNPKARKRYNCDGREQIEYNYDENDPAHNDAKQQINDCQGINKGDKYINQFVRESAHEVYTWRCCEKCRDIITKFKFYNYD